MSLQTFNDAARASRQERAAVLVAEDALPDREIAQAVGVRFATLRHWRGLPTFRARVAHYQDAARERLTRQYISAKDNRIDQLHEQYRRLMSVVLERAADPEMADVPGGKSGMLARSYYSTSKGTILPVYSVDVATLRELRETLKQVAQERGEWLEKAESTNTTALLVRVEYVDRPIGPGMAALASGYDNEGETD